MVGSKTPPTPAGAPTAMNRVGEKLEASLNQGLAVRKQRNLKVDKLREIVDRDPDKVASALRAMIQDSE